jgi:hypothetical protein
VILPVTKEQKPTQPFRTGHVGFRNPNNDNPSRVAWSILILCVKC